MPDALIRDSDPLGPDRPLRMAVYAGVFDPPTMAHLEIIESALRIFDRLTVIVGFNPNKGQALFTPAERVQLLEASLPEELLALVRVEAYSGLIANYAESIGACALVRGMRPYQDADAEIALALMNQKLAPRLPTVLLVASAKNVYLSSSFVRETAQLGGQVVPGSVSAVVEAALRRRFPSQPSGDQLAASPASGGQLTASPGARQLAAGQLSRGPTGRQVGALEGRELGGLGGSPVGGDRRSARQPGGGPLVGHDGGPSTSPTEVDAQRRAATPSPSRPAAAGRSRPRPASPPRASETEPQP